MEVVQVAQYESETSDEEVVEENTGINGNTRTPKRRKSKCNCPTFYKSYICKRVVGMAIRVKYCKPPSAAKTVPSGEKRKRGRPAKAKPALLVQ
jgi:hypothetical protein